jgi:hypothetical protein
MILREQIYDSQIETINEGLEKSVYITGPFLQADVVNRNRRTYPNRIVEPAVNKYINEYVNTSRALGELEHPNSSTINIERATHLITELHRDGNNYIGKAKILGTPMGNIVKSLLEGGVKIGVSSRGTGETKKRPDGITEVKSYNLHTVDVVYSPSAPDAFVETLLESQVFEQILQEGSMLKEFDEFLGYRKLIKESNRNKRFNMSIDMFDKLIKSFK